MSSGTYVDRKYLATDTSRDKIWTLVPSYFENFLSDLPSKKDTIEIFPWLYKVCCTNKDGHVYGK